MHAGGRWTRGRTDACFRNVPDGNYYGWRALGSGGRLADFHLRDRFAAVEIVESKNIAVFRSFAATRSIDPAVSWVVGDSYTSDIEPAKGAGFRTVLLESPDWVEVERRKELPYRMQ